jgi:cellulose synthase/poly-beta-1,6-N-acetylglucosamine synthase-like glycosyltransferase
VRLVVNAIAHWRYKSIPIPKKPTYHPRDITVIIPTINIDSEKLRRTTESILACNPSQIILVTQNSEYATLQLFASSIKIDKIKIFKAQIANKRRQLCQAIPQVKTRIVVLVDDDVMWPSEILPWLLAPFEDPRIGGVGTCQRVTEVPHKSRSRTKDGATTRINRKLINYKSITTLWITTKLKMCTGSIEI